MKKTLWLITSGDHDGTATYVPILANTKADVGKYIKNNIDKFEEIFSSLYNCMGGKVRDDLEEIYDEHGYDVDTPEGMAKISKVINRYNDEKLVDELWGVNKDTESTYVTINKIPQEDIIDITKSPALTTNRQTTRKGRTGYQQKAWRPKTVQNS